MRLHKLTRTTAFQVTMLYVLLFGVSVTILFGFIYWSSIGTVQRQTDSIIEIEIIGLAEQYQQRGLNGLVRVIGQRLEANPDGETMYLFATDTYRPLAGNLEAWPQLVTTSDGWANFVHTNAAGEAIPARGRVFALRNNLRLLVARDIRELDRLTRLFNRALLWGLGITLTLALAGGFVLSRSIRRRLQAINLTSGQIMEGDLSRRIATRGTGDEFDDLAQNLNAMLDQIESLMGSIQHMSDNVAHDLRTPLTRLRNQLERLRQKGDDTLQADVDACLEDADGLLKTFAALRRIARIESGTYEANRSNVDLAEITRDACDFYAELSDERGIVITCDAGEPVIVEGDRDLIFQAVINLLDNAIKYTPAGGRIVAAVIAATDKSIFTVSDTGPGIPAEMREKVTQRFFRLDDSRSKPGSGLGMSLVKAIALRHRAQLVLDDNNPGLRVSLEFPK